ncbi:alpha/beta hydrolase-fold protein [Flavobacterium selenitireducens]|uniref:alpha/beta hydrolase-fold protein n=1 Tax=Flavobacterium selenitireducens TaxID=2722704 RepID=UPI00168A7A4A|nr:alpha/beta hydrolase-fold protein [Flavobacterium selenitireducens]MBD3581796.1 alpha/beta hydrolase [Flavobacterium selenitireducens]
MRAFLFVASVLFCTAFASAQNTVIDSVKSKKLGVSREISIALPPSYKKDKDRKFPLLILLDGEYLMPAFTGALDYGAYWEDIPEMIVVGISQNKNGERDADTTFDKETGLPEGKGADFFDFIGTELVPIIEKSYRVAPLKLIAGHDMTAGFANYFLYKDIPVFDGYILLSPDMPPGMEEQIPERLTKIQKPIWYYHATADGDVKKLATRIRKLDETAKTVKRPGLNYRFDDFKGASHYSLVLYAIPSALYGFFSVYQPISANEFNEKIATLQEGYVQYLVDKYDVIEKTMGMKMKIRLNDFKAIEAAIIKNKAYNEFDQLSQLADKQYPRTMLADYEMGQMYEKKGDYPRAIKAYMRAYQMQEVGDLTKDMMFEKAEELKKM